MSRLEKIVRPFQGTDVFNARRLPPSPLQAEGGSNSESVSEAANQATITWGKGLDSTFLRPDTLMEFKSDWQEKSRTTETVRVSNPDDDSQFVDVERIKQLVLENRKTGEQLNFNMNWPST